MRARNILLIMILPAAVIAVGLVSTQRFEKGHSYDPSIRWTSPNAQSPVLQITSGKTTAVPFRVSVEGSISDVSLSIKDEALKEKGISLEQSIVPVIDGIASSKAIFQIRPDSNIKPGRYLLGITVSNTKTGKIVNEGDMPFALDMLDLIWKCSC